MFLFQLLILLMDKTKLSKNFTLSQENIKDTLAAFKANKSIADETREVFQAATLVSSAHPSARTPAPSLALVLMSRGFRFAASRTSVPFKMLASSKALATPKEVLKEPIIISESKEDSSEEGTRSPTLSVSPIRAIGNIIIGGRAANCARTLKLVEVGPLLSIRERGQWRICLLPLTMIC